MEEPNNPVTPSSLSLLGVVGRPFHYRPLSSEDMIRLIVLKPGKADERIKCTIITAKLVNTPKYEAVSYTWGSSDKLVVIWCDRKKLEVTLNLYTALRTFRHPIQSRILWADAICINQQDIPERNAQVRLMRQIFQRASRVLAWLGPEDRRDYEAMELIQEIRDTCVSAGYSDPQDLVDHKIFQTLAGPLYPSLTLGT
ncbi:heterokaryon incompatibility protein-domain-containing protein [Xylogone sp. PMI_703]|nr:heterokaryon incompatibility protein-domain-containing protein [Xylogone sp. PMI_703]